MAGFIDLTGRVFGRLTVVADLGSRNQRRVWECVCECGNRIQAITCNLTRDHTTSCGCVRRERISAAHLKHGKTGSRVHRIWQNMLNRCKNPNVPCYPNYGGRGIKVCERWKSFENFLADMGEPGPEMSIDRIDVNGDYEPLNCRWATAIVQQSNTRKNRFLTHNGKTQTVSTWAREVGINPTRIALRLAKGWSVEKALTTPIRKMKGKSEWQIRAQSST